MSREDGGWALRRSGDPAMGRLRGISGAAYIDFLALALEDGFLNPFGRLDRTHPGVVLARDDDGDEEARAPVAGNLYVSEADIAELLQAKAAIAGGVATLLEVAGLRAEDLRTLMVAGGFGYHLNPRHARSVGLLPEVEDERIEVVGNASLGGASLWLLESDRSRLAPLSTQCRVIELNQIPSFEDHFTDALCLGPAED